MERTQTSSAYRVNFWMLGARRIHIFHRSSLHCLSIRMPLPSKVHPDHTYVHLAAMQPEKHLLFVVNSPVYRYARSFATNGTLTSYAERYTIALVIRTPPPIIPVRPALGATTDVKVVTREGTSPSNSVCLLSSNNAIHSCR
jgi:hypothetical protein